MVETTRCVSAGQEQSCLVEEWSHTVWRPAAARGVDELGDHLQQVHAHRGFVGCGSSQLGDRQLGELLVKAP